MDVVASRNGRRTEESSTKRLLAVLLVDALETVGRGRGAPGSREARAWLCAPESREPYSFAHACEVLGIPARALRRRVGLRPQAVRRSSARAGRKASSRPD
jgi:hypothetical protein